MLLRLEDLLSEEKSDGRRRGRRRGRRKSGGGGNAPKEQVADKQPDSVTRALARFKANPPPIGFPSEIDPPPKTIEVNWPLNEVPKEVQKQAGEIIMRRGEFGFLPQERVDEIADQRLVPHRHLVHIPSGRGSAHRPRPASAAVGRGGGEALCDLVVVRDDGGVARAGAEAA